MGVKKKAKKNQGVKKKAKKSPQTLIDKLKAFTSPSLATTRKLYWECVSEGIVCPCCDRWAKRYVRPLNYNTCYALILIHRYFEAHPDAEWLHVEDHFSDKSLYAEVMRPRGQQHSLLRWWGLLEKKHGRDEEGNPSLGLYRLTEKGQQFVSGEIEVNRDIWTYNQDGGLVSASPMVWIHEVIGDKFSWKQLMETAEPA